MDWLSKKEELENAVKAGESYEGLGRKFNVSGGYIRKLCKKLCIDMPHRRKINPKETFNKGKIKTLKCKNCGKEFLDYNKKAKFCCLECSNNYKKEKYYQYYLTHQDEFYGKMNISWLKEHILKEQNCQCAICGINNIWNDKELIFILDHIDGRANNNNRDNLRLICPNCDSQLDTYKSKNKNSDRIYYHYNHR